MSHHPKGPKEDCGPREASLPATRPTDASNSSALTVGSKLFSHDRIVNDLNLVVTEWEEGSRALIDLVRTRVLKCRHQIEKSPEDKRTISQELDELGDYLGEVVDYHRYMRAKLRDLRTHIFTVVKLDGENLSDILS